MNPYASLESRRLLTILDDLIGDTDFLFRLAFVEATQGPSVQQQYLTSQAQASNLAASNVHTLGGHPHPHGHSHHHGGLGGGPNDSAGPDSSSPASVLARGGNNTLSNPNRPRSVSHTNAGVPVGIGSTMDNSSSSPSDSLGGTSFEHILQLETVLSGGLSSHLGGPGGTIPHMLHSAGGAVGAGGAGGGGNMAADRSHPHTPGLSNSVSSLSGGPDILNGTPGGGGGGGNGGFHASTSDSPLPTGITVAAASVSTPQHGLLGGSALGGLSIPGSAAEWTQWAEEYRRLARKLLHERGLLRTGKSTSSTTAQFSSGGGGGGGGGVRGTGAGGGSNANANANASANMTASMDQFVQAAMQLPADVRVEGTVSDDRMRGRLNGLRSFVVAVRELRNMIDENMQSTFEEDRMREEQLKDVVSREKKAAAQVKQLQRDLANEMRERERQISAKNDVINKLRDDLKAVRQKASDKSRIFEDKMQTAETDSRRQYDQRVRSLNEQIAQLERELGETISGNRGLEQHMSKRKLKNEQEVENWIRKYDDEMDQKARELMELTRTYNRNQKRLDWLSDELRKLDDDKQRCLEEERIQQEEQARAEAELQRRHAAATLIQSIFRGYIVRKKVTAQKLAKRTSAKGKKGTPAGAGKSKSSLLSGSGSSKSLTTKPSTSSSSTKP